MPRTTCATAISGHPATSRVSRVPWRLNGARRIAFTFFALTMAGGCKRKGIEISTAAYIVGPTSDIKTVNEETGRSVSPEILNASTLIVTHLSTRSIKFCSGTLISPETPGGFARVLTSHHCFAVTDGEDKATRTLLPESCKGTKVYVGFVLGRTEKSAALGCQADSLRTNFDGDLGVFTLDAALPSDFHTLELWDGEDAPSGRAAVIVHYPDTQAEMAFAPGESMKLPVAQLTLRDCQTRGAFDVGEWDLDRTLPYSLKHTCDLVHGSSGSGLIDLETAKILGVNWGGIKISTDVGTTVDNVATRASFVRAFLDGTVEQVVATANAKRTAKNTPAAKSEAQSGSMEKETEKALATVKGQACGVVSSRREPLSFWLLFWVGLVPALSRVSSGWRVWRPR